MALGTPTLRYNGLVATIGASGTNSQTTITFAAALTYQNGTALPTFSVGGATNGQVYCQIVSAATGQVLETILITAYTLAATSATIFRNADGKGASAFSAGDLLVCDAGPIDFGIVVGIALTWGSSGTAPALVNGTFTNVYAIFGPLCYFSTTVIFGTSTTYGTGNWTLALPFSTAQDCVVKGSYRAGSGNNPYMWTGSVAAGNQNFGMFTEATTAGAVNRNITPTVPITAASGGILRASGCFFWM